MNFYKYLADLIEHYKLSKNKLIKDTGIDRSSFFQFLKGTRKPTGQQLLKIIHAAGFTEEEKAHLHELYVKEKHGEETFRTWSMIREGIEAMDGSTPEEPADTPVSRFFAQVCEEAGNNRQSADDAVLHFDLFLPISFYTQANITAAIGALPRMYAGRISVRVIVVNFSDHDIPEHELVDVFLRSVLIYREPRLDLKLYHYPGKYQRTDLPLIGYPFFALNSGSILMINDLSEDYKVLKDADFLRQYADSFEEFLKKCSPLSYRSENEVNYAQYLQSALKSSDDELLYTLEFLPCVFSVAPLDMVDKYAPPVFKDFARAYVSAYQTDIHMKQYFSPEGMRVFRKDRMLYMAGPNVRLNEEDTEKLCLLMREKLGTQISCLDPSRFRISEQWCIASGRKALLFASYAQESVFVISLDPQICRTFYNYFSHLDEDGAELAAAAAEEMLR